MTKRIILNMLVMALALISYAQDCDDCYEDNGISTNPNNPENCQIELRWPTSTFTNQFKNTFNWGASDPSSSQFLSIGLNPNAGWLIPDFTGSNFSMFSPFTQEYLENNNASVDGHDWHWEDGWELMWMNTGYFPNGDGYDDPLVNTDPIVDFVLPLYHRRVPYITLYNRYTGKMRVMFNVFDDFGSQDINLEVGYDKIDDFENKSGIFRHLSGYDLPLDQQTVSQGFNASFKNGNNMNSWFITEFQLGYDPCVCDYFSQLNFNLAAIQTYNLSLVGRSISADLKLKDASGPVYDDFLNMNSVEDAANSGTGGALIYKSLDKMLDTYDANLEQYQNDINDYNDPSSKALRAGLAVAKTGLKYGLQLPVPESILKDFGKTIAGVVTTSSDDAVLAANGKYYSKEMSKMTKAILGTTSDQLFAEFSTKVNKPVKPDMPTATFTEMAINGDMTRSDPITVADLYTPGSFKVAPQGTPQVPPLEAGSYPAYNKPVGLFAMLETPSVLALDRKSNFSGSIVSRKEYEFTNFGDINKVFFIKERQFSVNTDIYLKLNETLKYRFNHSVDFNHDETETYVQIIVELEDGNSHSHDNGNTVFEMKTNLYEQENVVGSSNTRVYVSDFYPVNSIGEEMFYIQTKNSKVVREELKAGVRVFNPISGQWADLLPPNAPNLLTPPDYEQLAGEWSTKVKKVKVKIMNDMYFESPGFDNFKKNTTQVFTYLLYDKQENIDFIESHGDWLEEIQIDQIKKYEAGTITLENEVIEPTDDFVFETIGTNIYVNAEEIELKGNITVQSGYKAIIQAYWGIESDPTTEIGQNIELAIKRDFYNFPETVEVDSTELSNYCSGTNKKYQANQAKAKRTLEPPKEEEQAIEYAFTVYPNPSSDMLNVESDIENSTVDLLNLDGKVISSFELKGYKASHNVSGISAGLYFVRLATPRGYKYLRFVKK